MRSRRFLASSLLFTAEPMVGKMVLPRFGGTPSVWNTCLLYFQVIVLIGYAASGGLITRGHDDRVASAAYLLPMGVLLAIGSAFPPFALDPSIAVAESDPTAGVFWTLVASSTIPMVLLAAAAPLIQHWFRLTGYPRSDDPYFLYAASNAGSLLALFTYPLAIEPNLRIARASPALEIGIPRRRGPAHGLRTGRAPPEPSTRLQRPSMPVRRRARRPGASWPGRPWPSSRRAG